MQLFKRHFWSLLWTLLCLYAKSSASIDGSSSCDFYQQVQLRQTYYIYNKEYPNKYTGTTLCRWIASSSYPLELSCAVDIDQSANCTVSRLTVSLGSGSRDEVYCGKGTLQLKSKGDVTVYLTSTSAGRGNFLCTVQGNPTINNTNCRCGYNKSSRRKRIVGGTETGVNEFPMMAGLVDVLLYKIYCGATIISNVHVLTAAHCLQTKLRANVAVIVGEHDVTTDSDTPATQALRSERFIIHPLYNAATYANDIGIVVVRGIVFSDRVGPVCLPFAHATSSFEGSTVTLLGWGTLFPGKTDSNTLQKVDVSVTSLDTCKQTNPTTTSKDLCTYTAGKDACQIDGGGPVLWQDPSTGSLALVGIIPHGNSCTNGQPSVNVRVTEYLQWIVANTPEIDYCSKE